MKTMFLGILFFVATGNFCNAQTTTDIKPNQLVEGAKMVVDIIKLLHKKENLSPENMNNKGKSLCNYCIYNSDSMQSIKVTLIPKSVNTGDTLKMVIKKLNKECSLQIPCGVYNCKIQSLDNLTISWGDVFIDAKIFH